MSRLDLRIRAACIADYGRRPAKEIARDLGISPKAVYERWHQARIAGAIRKPPALKLESPAARSLAFKLRRHGFKGAALREALQEAMP